MVSDCLLTADEARVKRDQLVKDGFTVIKHVLPTSLLSELRDFTSELLDQVTVSDSLRFQGSSQFVYTPRSRTPDAPSRTQHKVVEKLDDDPTQQKVAALLGLESLRPRGRRVEDDINIIVLSKPPHAPPLYWHQDFRDWNSPVAATPWPHQVCFTYYLTDTTPENGCLRVIPGSHRKWHPLHDLLPNAHESEIQRQERVDSPIFAEAEGSIDVPVAAGDLVICDARVLHSAWGNNTDHRRTAILSWYNCFHFPRPPSWWRSEVPPEVWGADTSKKYVSTRVPNIPWRPRNPDYHAPWGPGYLQLRRHLGLRQGNKKSALQAAEQPVRAPDSVAAQLISGGKDADGTSEQMASAADWLAAGTRCKTTGECTVKTAEEPTAVQMCIVEQLDRCSASAVNFGCEDANGFDPLKEAFTEKSMANFNCDNAAEFDPLQLLEAFTCENASGFDPLQLLEAFTEKSMVNLNCERATEFDPLQLVDVLTEKNMMNYGCEDAINFDPLQLQEALTEQTGPCLEPNAEPHQCSQCFWHKCQTSDGRDYWWCELDFDWFWDDDPGLWVKYKDPDSGMSYWWRDDENCFWVPD